MSVQKKVDSGEGAGMVCYILLILTPTPYLIVSRLSDAL